MTMMKYKKLFTDISGHRLGFEYSQIGINGQPYLDRYICYLLGATLRLHKFWRGDDDRAPHDHPWWFVTFPLTSYYEYVFPLSEGLGSWPQYSRLVKAGRFHFRPATFRHYVIGRADGKRKPFWTFVITGQRTNAWGFWPFPNFFVPWREWK